MTAEPALDFASLGLDKANQDDRLLASVVEFTAQLLGDRVGIVTADIGLRVKAHSRCIEVVALDDDLRLPDEPDPQEKKIKQLERELLELNTSCPD